MNWNYQSLEVLPHIYQAPAPGHNHQQQQQRGPNLDLAPSQELPHHHRHPLPVPHHQHPQHTLQQPPTLQQPTLQQHALQQLHHHSLQQREYGSLHHAHAHAHALPAPQQHAGSPGLVGVGAPSQPSAVQYAFNQAPMPTATSQPPVAANPARHEFSPYQQQQQRHSAPFQQPPMHMHNPHNQQSSPLSPSSSSLSLSLSSPLSSASSPPAPAVTSPVGPQTRNPFMAVGEVWNLPPLQSLAPGRHTSPGLGEPVRSPELSVDSESDEESDSTSATEADSSWGRRASAPSMRPRTSRLSLSPPAGRPARVTSVSATRSGPSNQDWERWKPVLEDLYMRQQYTLNDAMEHMLTHYNFKASQRMYKRRIDKWRWFKYNTKRVQEAESRGNGAIYQVARLSSRGRRGLQPTSSQAAARVQMSAATQGQQQQQQKDAQQRRFMQHHYNRNDPHTHQQQLPHRIDLQHHQPAHHQPAHHQPAHPQPAHPQPAHYQPAQNQPAQNQRQPAVYQTSTWPASTTASGSADVAAWVFDAAADSAWNGILGR